MYTHKENIITQGRPLSETGKALIMIHGRGATAASILALKQEFDVSGFTLFAPQATNNSWYPYSFMAPVEQNQPALDSALELLDKMVNSILEQGIKSKDIYLLGFSQGACLTVEYATRHAHRYGGLIILTGGLIGQEIDKSNYKGNFNGSPVLITTGDPDPHVPVSRVEETLSILQEKGANVSMKVFKGRQHTVSIEEIK